MSAGDVLKLSLNYRVGLQVATNVFHYRQTIGVLGGEQLASAWITEVFDEIKAVSSSVTTYVDVSWLNYNDPTDFGIDPSIGGQVGARAGECLPIYNAWGFQYNRESRITRNGAKRFSAIAETDNNNGAPAPGSTTMLTNLGNSLGQLINFGGTEWWEPVIARLTPDGSAVLLVNGVKSVTFKRITTQNSRKSY